MRKQREGAASTDLSCIRARRDINPNMVNAAVIGDARPESTHRRFNPFAFPVRCRQLFVSYAMLYLLAAFDVSKVLPVKKCCRRRPFKVLVHN